MTDSPPPPSDSEGTGPARPQSTDLIGGILGTVGSVSAAARAVGRELGGAATRVVRQVLTEAEQLIEVAAPSGDDGHCAPARPGTIPAADSPEPLEPHESGDQFPDNELREVGDRLLGRSAELHAADGVHPAFRAILTQLTTDEARILRFLVESGPQPSIDIRIVRPFGGGVADVVSGLSMIAANAGCSRPERIETYLGNLERLGLVRTHDRPVALAQYELLRVQPNVVEMLARAGRRARVDQNRVEVTSMGRDFSADSFTLPPRPHATSPTEKDGTP